MPSSSVIYTAEKNGVPLNTTIGLLLTPQEFSRGCDKIVTTTRVDQYARMETVDLSVQVVPGMPVGTVFTFEKLGNYIGDGVFQTVNVVLEEEQRPQSINQQPIQSQSIYQQPIQSQSIYQQPTELQLTKELMEFSIPKNLKNWQYHITYFSNGDIGIQQKLPFIVVDGVAAIPFKYALKNGMHLKISINVVGIYGQPFYLRNVFEPVAGYTGNMWIFLIVTLDKSTTTSCLCC